MVPSQSPEWEWARLAVGSGASHLSEEEQRSLGNKGIPLFRTLSEKHSVSLKVAEVMNSSQDGSPTLQACGVLGIHPAVSCRASGIPQVWKERESVAPQRLQPSHRPIKKVKPN